MTAPKEQPREPVLDPDMVEWMDAPMGPPAPPPSEESEARWYKVESWDDPLFEVWRSDAGDGETFWVLHPVAAAIRAPLEEQVRDLRRWAEIDHGNLEAAGERIRRLERDNNTLSKGVRVLGHELAHEKARAETAEAENAKLQKALTEANGFIERANLIIDTALLPGALPDTAAAEGGEE